MNTSWSCWLLPLTATRGFFLTMFLGLLLTPPHLNPVPSLHLALEATQSVPSNKPD